jgi:mono/diheme cytochrome c family protein
MRNASGSTRLAAALAGLVATLAATPATAVDEALAARGKALSQLHCARCHVVTPENRMTGIASTPSFMILVQALEDWRDRFETFHARLPHPAHLRFADDAPRPQDHPATIAEVILEIDDLEAIVAYAEKLKADGE